MIAMFLFSAMAALLVFLAGRADAARDPRFTTVALALLAVFPLLLWFVPKTRALPVGLGETVEAMAPAFPWMRLVAVVWLIGSSIIGLRLVLALRVIHRWRKQSVSCGVVDGVEIRRLSPLKGPVAAGVFKPVIFVPDAWVAWPATTRGIVLAHELGHHRRRDPLRRWLAEIACLVNGGNPLVLWMARRLAVQCEYACDVTVVEQGIHPSDYARLLCDLAEDIPSGGPMLAMAGRSNLESRVRRLVKPGAALSKSGFALLMVPTIVIAGGLVTFRQQDETISIPRADVKTRLAADPFPGELEAGEGAIKPRDPLPRP